MPSAQLAGDPADWRFDVRIEEDLIEEFARLFGFDHIPERHEQGAHEMAHWTVTRVSNERASDLLMDRGFQEVINYAFTDAAVQAALCPEPAVALSNPISGELAGHARFALPESASSAR